MNPLDRFIVALDKVITAPATPNKDAEIGRIISRLIGGK